jgi:hypothetical protein
MYSLSPDIVRRCSSNVRVVFCANFCSEELRGSIKSSTILAEILARVLSSSSQLVPKFDVFRFCLFGQTVACALYYRLFSLVVISWCSPEIHFYCLLLYSS